MAFATIFNNIEIRYSGLEDFCCPEFYKGKLPHNRNNQPIKINEKQSIQFNEKCNVYWVNKNFFKITSLPLPKLVIAILRRYVQI